MDEYTGGCWYFDEHKRPNIRLFSRSVHVSHERHTSLSHPMKFCLVENGNSLFVDYWQSPTNQLGWSTSNNQSTLLQQNSQWLRWPWCFINAKQWFFPHPTEGHHISIQLYAPRFCKRHHQEEGLQFEATKQKPKNHDMYSLAMGVTLWQTNIAIENGPFIVDLPIPDGDFP